MPWNYWNINDHNLYSLFFAFSPEQLSEWVPLLLESLLYVSACSMNIVIDSKLIIWMLHWSEILKGSNYSLSIFESPEYMTLSVSVKVLEKYFQMN